MRFAFGTLLAGLFSENESKAYFIVGAIREQWRFAFCVTGSGRGEAGQNGAGWGGVGRAVLDAAPAGQMMSG